VSQSNQSTRPGQQGADKTLSPLIRPRILPPGFRGAGERLWAIPFLECTCGKPDMATRKGFEESRFVANKNL